MGVRCRIVVEGDNEENAAAACAAAFDRIAGLDAVLSDYRTDSEVAGLAKAPAGVWLPVSTDLAEVLHAAQAVYEATDGSFDPAVGRLTRLWRTSRRAQALPDDATLAEARERSGMHLLEMNGSRVRFRKSGVQLDFGGIGKGYAADEALAVLAEAGFGAALIDFSGDLVAGGPPSDEPRGWRVEISDGAGGREVRWLKHGAIAASGDAEQFVAIDGVRYAHIVDPKTGLGVPGPVAATVGAPTGVLADALASAACVMGKQSAARLEEAFEGVWVRVQAAD